MKNYEFDLSEDNHLVILHMMDNVDKYLSRVTIQTSGELPLIQIQGPELFPQDMLSMIEQSIQSRFPKSFKPKPELRGVISIKTHDPYTIVFELSKLWFEQKLEDVQIQIVNLMGIEDDYVDIEWARIQLDEGKDTKDS